MRESNKTEKIDNKRSTRDKLKRRGNLTHLLTLTETGWPGLMCKGSWKARGHTTRPLHPVAPFSTRRSTS